MQILSVNVSEQYVNGHRAKLVRLPLGLRSVQPLCCSLAGYIHPYGPRSPALLRFVASSRWSGCNTNGRGMRKAKVDGTLATLLVADVDCHGAHLESTLPASSRPLRCLHTHVLLALPAFCLP